MMKLVFHIFHLALCASAVSGAVMGAKICLPPTTTKKLVHGICGKGVSSFSASSSMANRYYTPVSPFEGELQGWDNKNYKIVGMEGTPCAGGTFLRSNNNKDIDKGTEISIDYVPSNDQSTICLFVTPDTDRDGGFSTTLEQQLAFKDYGTTAFPDFKRVWTNRTLVMICRDHLPTSGSIGCNEPTPTPTRTPGSVSGDPHFTTWAGDHYDYHGLCDLVFLQNPGFKNGLGMDIHIRTKKFKQWSYVSNVALQIENDILEVTSGTGTGADIGVQYWISYIAGDSTLTHEKDTILPYTIAGYPVIFRRLSLQSVEFTVDLGDDAKITIQTWKKLVRVDIHGATDTDFGASLGLMGSFQDGKHMARDNNTVLENIDDFGQEWQVRADEPKLFHNADGAQHPQQCQSPTVADMKRRLGHSLVSQEEAEIACARASVSDFELCVFDVMATSDVNVAGAF